ncbi:MAG: mechanosensitive ion channel family protein [Acidobacteriota bacterium]|nr:mechanosensitive ion channel family protein [Acidobacteriota bacterium]MDQ7088943.1 mechanosensitive ion channel family protein [Acidobacteriota bacterium]
MPRSPFPAFRRPWPWIVLALLLPAIPPGGAWAQDPGAAPPVQAGGQTGSSVPAALASPRATFRTFLDAMVAVRRGEKDRLREAVSCLDLADLPPAAREEAGRKFARDLKIFLDKTEWVDLEQLPAEWAEPAYVWRRFPAGVIALERDDDGRWLFSRQTRQALPDLLESVRDRAFIGGLEGGGGVEPSVADLLRARMPEALRERAFLLENWQWLALLALVLLGVIVDRVLRYLVGVRIRKLLGGRLQRVDAAVITRFEAPLGILTMTVVWSILLPLLDLSINVIGVLEPAIQVLMAVAGVWATYRLVDVASEYFASLTAETESKLDDLLVPLVRRALKIIVVAFGMVFIAQNLDIPIASLVTGLGLGGLAFALAAKDTVENLFGSVTVLIDRPFQLGDWIVIGDLEGTVVELGLRSTRIRTFYNSVITIPNSKLVSAAVDNLGAREYRRIKTYLSVKYDTPPEKIEAFCEGMRELVRRHPFTRKDYYNIYLNRFGASGLDILFYVFHKAPDWTTELRERHRLFLDILELARRLGVEFAFPTQTLHIASVPEGFAGAPAPPAPEAVPGFEEVVRQGREQARQVMEESWGQGVQPPVDFDDPDRIRPTPLG